MKIHSNCFLFLKTFKTVGYSNSGRETEKVQHENFCSKFHTVVNPNGKICRHWNDVGEKEGGDE